MNTRDKAAAARESSVQLAAASTEIRNKALLSIAAALAAREQAIVAANQNDLRRSEAERLAAPLLKRLKFDAGKLSEAIEGIRVLAALPDPVGRTLEARELDSGLNLYRVSCPIGVIGVIFESRPDALVQISALCLKSGNAALLKGGSEALETNRALASVVSQAAIEAGAPEGWLQLLETRDEVGDMLKLDDLVDLIVPRGSSAFVRHIMDRSRIPVLGHADGICHVYVDAEADLGMALRIVRDSKCQYAAVCNAVETLLVHESVAAEFLPRMQRALVESGVELRGCERTLEYIDARPATEADWGTEYLDLILSVRVVRGIEEAVRHINRYGSGHTDTIATKSAEAARFFLRHVDSGNVFWNCSTRFSDGYRYGLGAEVGISTSKLHARGPVGLEGLLIYKWALLGDGHTVEPYASGKAAFTHRPVTGACPL